MDLRTYRAKTMASALAEVKKDLGPDAVIVRTRSYRAGGVLGFGGSAIVEITAAADSVEITPRPRRLDGTPGPAARPGPPPRQTDSADRVPARVAEPAPAPPLQQAPPLRQAPPLQPVSHRESGVPATAPAGSSGVTPTRVRFAPESDRAQAALEAELASIRRMVGEVLQTARRTSLRVDGTSPLVAGSAGRPSPISEMYSCLCEQELPPDWVDDLIADARADLGPAESEDPALVRETVQRLLAARFRVLAPAEPVSGSPVIETLVGPTGVGKTTTIAKLAAAHRLRFGRSVGLITADTYRIAAVEQLRTYAGIIGIPLEVVLTPEEMRSAIGRLASRDVVLVDTPGRSPRDGARLDELRAFLDAAGSTRTHLVVSAISSTSVIESIAERFAPLRPDAVMVTKLDEATRLGVIGHAAAITGLPFSYVTTGQEVPDHIEAARPERLARVVLQGALHAEGAP